MFEHVFDTASPDAALTAIESTYREESTLMARRMAAIADLLTIRTEEAWQADPDPGYSIITGFARTSAEVGAAMNMAPMTASRMVAQAEALDARLPKIAAMLACGAIDWRTTQLVITRTELVGDTQIATVDTDLATRIGGWETWSRKRAQNAIDKVVRTVDPEAAKERRATADSHRYINTSARPDGTARLRGRVTAKAAAAFEARISASVTSVCAKDPRTMDQRRADAFDSIVEGRTMTCACGRPECPSGEAVEAEPGGVRTVINIIATEDTVTGSSEEPGYLEGYGVIDADMVREQADDATLRLVEPPEVTEEESLRYQPSAALARWIRCRDLTCRAPGCDRPVARCDLDHTTPFDRDDPASGGLTVATGLAAYCREHHRLKTFHGGADGWSDEQLADGTIVWTSPTGRVYRTAPSGLDLFPSMRPACAAPTPRKRSRSREKASRIRSARNRLRVQRPVSAAQRHLDFARRQEIRYRKERNRMRKTLFVLTGGKPSKSPFSPWINDPLEPEELEPGWRPPPRAPALDCDDPPF